jgi:raffinose/stachyose/melibiose transport system substrate-binding protein
MKKKFEVLLVSMLVLFIALPVFANGGKDASGAGVDSSGKKEITVFEQTGQILDEKWASYFADFTKETGYAVNKIDGGQDIEFSQNLAIAMNGGQEIDVLILNGQRVPSLVSRGLIKDLTNLVPYWDRFVPASVAQFTYGGKHYGVPWNEAAGTCLYYNQDLLKKYNLPVPKTYDDLLKIRDAVSKDGLYTFAMGGNAIYYWPIYYMDTFAQTSGGKSIEETLSMLRGKSKFTEKDAVDAMAILQKMGKDNLFGPPGYIGLNADEGRALFTSGKCVLYFNGIWDLATLRQSGMTGDTLGITLFPVVVPGAKAHESGVLGGAALALSSAMPKGMQDISLKLIDYMSSDKRVQSSTPWQNGESGLKRPNKAYKYPANTDPLVMGPVDKIIIPSYVTYLDWIWPPEIVTAFQHQIQAVVGLQTSPQNAMAAIQKVYDGLVADGYKYEGAN